MIQTAVILSAGLGMRLKTKTDDKPKGFITLGKSPIIRESVDKLLDAGIERIIIVKKIENLAWGEIDDARQLKTAKEKIYPKIRNRDASSPVLCFKTGFIRPRHNEEAY